MYNFLIIVTFNIPHDLPVMDEFEFNSARSEHNAYREVNSIVFLFRSLSPGKPRGWYVPEIDGKRALRFQVLG
jgi:hypothetical protein